MPSLLDVEPIYCAEQIVVPPELPDIMKAYTKEVIRNQPENIFEFSANYFAQFVSSNETDSTLEQLVQLVNQEFKTRATDEPMTVEEVRTACAAAGYPEHLLNKVLALQGSESAAGVDFSEFIVLALTLEAESLMQVVQMIFTVFNQEEGLLTVDEFLRHFGHLATRDKRLSDEVISALRDHLNQSAAANDGKISYEHFCDAPVVASFS
eukprot:Rmarinus@m.27132